MFDKPDIGNKADFLNWIDATLAQLAVDDQEKPAITGDRYENICSDAEQAAVILGLHNVIEAIGPRPPSYVIGSNQTALSGLRDLLRAKLLRIRPLLTALGYHDVNSKETFLQWIDEQLAQLDSDDQTQPEIQDARYGEMHGLAEHFAARLALHEALEALGTAPPGFAGPDRQTYLSGIRNLMRVKLLRIQRLLTGGRAISPDDASFEDDLTDRERNILEAIGAETMIASRIAKAAGYANNSAFRNTLSSLVKRKHLTKGPRGIGYLRRSIMS